MRYFVDSKGLEDASPTDLRARARELHNVVNAIERTVRQLSQVSVHAVWDSPSGDTFAAEVGRTPSTLTDVANRLRGTADAITPYAGLLEASKKAVTTYDTAAADASTKLKDCDRQLKEMAPDDPDRARVQRERGRASLDLLRAERAFEKELESARRDENQVAVKLHDVALKVDDPTGYDLLEGLSVLGQTASTVGIVAKPVAVVGVADPLGKAGRRLFYDEGSYKDVASSSLGYGLDTVSFGAGRIVKGARKRFDGKQVERVGDLPGAPVRIKDNPITKAPKTTAPITKAKAPSASTSTAAATRQRLTSKAKERARETIRKKTGLADMDEAFDDWKAVAGEGRVAKVSVVVKHTAKQTKRVTSNAKSADSAVDKVADGTEEDRRAAEQDRRRASAADLGAGPAEDPRVARVR